MNYLSLLSSLGLHIGSSSLLRINDPLVHQFLVGIRNNYYVFNLSYSVFYLKRTLSFFESIASMNPYNCVCFYHSETPHSVLAASVMAFFGKECQQSAVISKWINGSFTNWSHMVYSAIKPLFSNRKERFEYGFQVILAKMIYILAKKSERMHELEFSVHYKSMSRFWKFILLFQFFHHFKKLPMSFLYFNPDLNNAPIRECNKVTVPVISIIDSDSSITGITYPIPGNDDSLILISFILSLVSQSILKGKYKFLLLNQLNNFDV